MIAGVSAAQRPTVGRGGRVAAGFVLAVLAAGCLVLWIGIPAAGLWLAGTLATESAYHLPIAFALILPGMVAMALILAWINDLYMRITGGEIQESEGLPYRRHGPLEPMLVISFVVALTALILWFFVLAENPARGIFG